MLKQSSGRRHFLGGKHPVFGVRQPSKRNLEQSPWYFWWLYLNRNVDYLKTCEANGAGKSALLYADFGDVRGDFKQWWTARIGKDNRGAYLFAEPVLPETMHEISAADQVTFHPDVLVLQMPLTLPRRELKKMFGALLRRKLGAGKRGRPIRKSEAKYPLRPCEVKTLKLQLQVYDIRKETAQPFWRIGQRCAVIKGWATTGTPDANERNVLANVAHRHYKRAEAAIKNVAKGRFPDYK